MIRFMRGPLYFGLSIRAGRFVWEPSLLAAGWVCERGRDIERIRYVGNKDHQSRIVSASLTRREDETR